MEEQLPHSSILSASFLLLLFTVILRSWIKPKNNHSTSSPPGPWKVPIIGSIHLLVGSLPHQGLRDMANKYGPVMQLQIGEVPTVIISSPQAAKEVMKTHELNFLGRPNLLVADIISYNRNDIGFAPYGEYWRQMRKVCILELLSAKRVKSFKSIREEEVSNFIESIRSKAGSPINLSVMMLDLSVSIIARVSIGKKCKNQEAFLPVVEQVMNAVGGVNLVDVFPSSKSLHMISKERSRLAKLHQEADEILENIINEHKASKEVTKIDPEDEAEDFLDVLLNLQNNGDLELSITTNSIKAIIMDMFSGGGETTARLMEWVISEMLKNPRIMEKAQEEVRNVFSDIQYVDESGLHNLKYLKLIIKETLRLHPPVPFIPRECINTCKINGYVIKSTTKLMINVWALGRDSDYWIEAKKFYPERFLDSSIDYKGMDFEFIPFGAGKRMCPGMLFAITEVELLLAQLLFHFDWKLRNGLASEDLDMDEMFGGTIKRKNNLILIPIPYSPSPKPGVLGTKSVRSNFNL